MLGYRFKSIFTHDILPHVLTDGPGSLPDLPMIGRRVSVGVPVVMGDGHVVQPVVLRGEGARVGQAVGLVGQPVGWAEALRGADGAGPLTGVHVWVQGAVPLEAVLFGSEGETENSGLLFHLHCMFTRMRSFI